MPFIHNTPESLLRRSDSRNPATTCKGITTSGNHCRRSIISSSLLNHHFPLSKSKKSEEGVLAVLEPASNVNGEGAAAFFCWQHKDQAIMLINSVHGERTTNIVKLKKRTSVDTLVERMGLLDTNDRGNGKSRRATRRQWSKERPARIDTLPKNWQDVGGPLLAVHGRREDKDEPPRRKKKPGLFMALCCTGFSDVDPLPPARVHLEDEKVSGMASTNERYPSQLRPLQSPTSEASQQQQQQQQQSHGKSTPPSPRRVKPSTFTSTAVIRPTPNRDPSSQTQTLLSLIPKTLSLQTTSALLAELAKPVSPHDEAGYIYIFWLTPSSSPSRPNDETASSLLTADSLSPPTTPRGRRQSEVISAHSTHNNSKTLLLKIGRAANVQRRMNQWTRQCGYDLSLIRFYPYLPSTTKAPPSPLPSPRSKSSPSTSSEGPMKVPCAHKVERLIHLELAEKRVRENCGACGREHKEWFEVRGTREGLRDVDCVIRRWVRWAQEG